MAEEPQPPTVHEGASATGDVEDEAAPAAKSAEDRKAAAALSSLDARGDDDDGRHVDHEAVTRAMDRLSGRAAANGAGGGGTARAKSGGAGAGAGTGAGAADKAEVKKVKIDAEDLALVMDELELSKGKATELLRTHDGDAVKAMRAYIQPPAPAVRPRW